MEKLHFDSDAVVDLTCMDKSDYGFFAVNDDACDDDAVDIDEL